MREERARWNGTPTIDSRAIYTRDATRRPIRSDPIPIRSDPSAAQQSGRVVERIIESMVVAVTPESLAAVGGYVTREGTDRRAAFSDAQSVEAYVGRIKWLIIRGGRAIVVKGSNCSLNGCAQVQQSPSIVVNDDAVRMRADGRTSWRKA